MPNIANDSTASGPVDYVDYFTKQLPLELARLANLRDELEKRQGGLSAVQAAMEDREVARKTLADAEAKAAVVDAALRDREATVTAREQKVVLAEKDFEAKQKAADAAAKARDADLTRREKACAFAEDDLKMRENDLAKGQAKLAADRHNLDNHIAAFQQKVASLNI